VSAAAVIAFGALIVIAAGAYHAVTEHHVHLRIAHAVNPRVEIPPTRHDTRWHAMTHRQRAYVNAGMIAMAVLLGLAWGLQPQVTTICVIIMTACAVTAAAARAVSRTLGQRRRPEPARRIRTRLRIRTRTDTGLED
jgi:hypothetical protein